MDKKVISYLLKTVVIFLFAVFLFAGFYIVPSYMRFMQRYTPHIGSFFVGVLLYINASFLPVYTCLALAWRVFTTVGEDGAFCPANVRRLKICAWLAMVDVLMIIAFYLFLRIGFAYLLNTIFLFLTICFILLGLSASLVCFALSKLVQQATDLKEEVDLTV